MIPLKLISKNRNAVTGEWTDPDFMTNMFGRVPRCLLRYMHHPQTQIHLPLVHILVGEGGWGRAEGEEVEV